MGEAELGCFHMLLSGLFVRFVLSAILCILDNVMEVISAEPQVMSLSCLTRSPESVLLVHFPAHCSLVLAHCTACSILFPSMMCFQCFQFLNTVRGNEYFFYFVVKYTSGVLTHIKFTISVFFTLLIKNKHSEIRFIGRNVQTGVGNYSS